MEQEDVTIQSITDSTEVVVNYSDSDIVIIDNVNKLVEPGSAHLNMNMVVLTLNGRATVEFNGQPAELHKNQIVIWPPHTTLTQFMMSPDFEFKAMFLTNSILQSFLREKMAVWNEVMYVHKTHIVTLESSDIDYFRQFYQILQVSVKMDANTPYRVDVIQSLLRAVVLAFCGKLKQMLPEESSIARKHTDNLFQQFLNLLSSSKMKHRSVASYASQLYISPKYLSFICKKNSGKTANEWIREQVLEDIRYYLRHTDYSIKQICDLTGFPNASFFGKYVKEHFGMSPSQFRKQ